MRVWVKLEMAQLSANEFWLISLSLTVIAHKVTFFLKRSSISNDLKEAYCNVDNSPACAMKHFLQKKNG